MSAKTDYLEKEIIDHILGKGSLNWSPPAQPYLALFTASPTDTGSMTNEVANANAYARQAINFATPSSDGSLANSGDVTFPQATGSWGTVTHFGIVDSSTHGAGNMLYHGALTASRTIDTDDILIVQSGDLVISEA
jgi:hypothetical protein